MAVKSNPSGTQPKRFRPDADDPTWLTRNQVVDMLRVNHKTVQDWERKGILNPKRAVRLDTTGAARAQLIYNPAELAKLPRARLPAHQKDPGETAARAFELFDHGKSIREAVIELRETPDKVRELKEKWIDAGGCDLVITPPAKAEIERVLGPFGSVTELVERVVEVIDLVQAVSPPK